MTLQLSLVFYEHDITLTNDQLSWRFSLATIIGNWTEYVTSTSLRAEYASQLYLAQCNSTSAQHAKVHKADLLALLHAH